MQMNETICCNCTYYGTSDRKYKNRFSINYCYTFFQYKTADVLTSIFNINKRRYDIIDRQMSSLNGTLGKSMKKRKTLLFASFNYRERM